MKQLTYLIRILTLLGGIIFISCASPALKPSSQVEDFEPAAPLKKPKVKTFGVDLEINETKQSREIVIEEKQETPAPIPIAEKKIERDLVKLFELEIAAQRTHNKEEILDQFISYARRYEDASVAARAYEMAQEIHSFSRSLTIAELWSSLDPTFKKAQDAYIKELILQSQYNEAFRLMEERHNKGERTNFRLIAIFAQLNNEREARRLIQTYQQYIQNYPELEKNLVSGMQLINYKLAELLFYQEELEKSLRLFNLLLSSQAVDDGILEGAHIFKARIYHLLAKTGSTAFYEQALQNYPNNVQIPVYYTLYLLNEGRKEDAQENLLQLFNQTREENTEEKLFLLAHIAQQLEFNELEKQTLNYYHPLVTENDIASLRLGLLAMRKNRNILAEDFFQLIEADSRLWGSVQLLRLKNILLLRDFVGGESLLEEVFLQDEQTYISLAGEYALELARKGHKVAAISILNEAELKTPFDEDLQMTKAFVYYELNNIEDMVEEFEALMQRNEEEPNLLNSFGYSLADKNIQLERAKEMIEKAVAAAPTNSAYVDSLGWVHYRLKNYPRAHELLRWAYSHNKNGEIAAHLGEVLWLLGKRERARLIWLTQYEREPNSSILLDTMARFNIDWNKLSPHIHLIDLDL